GDNIAIRSANMPWYRGPVITEALDALVPVAADSAQPFRMPVQDVYKFDHRRIIAGRIESGVLNVGDEVIFSPSNKVVRVHSIESWPAAAPGEEPKSALAGQSVGFTLDEQIFVERGEVVSHVAAAPVETDVFRARVFWLGHEPLT